MAFKTPLRYPGGKQKLFPFILEVLSENNLVGGDYAEAYAGGAGVAMELLLEDQVAHVHLNDSCKVIYAFWQSILKQTDEFCRRIADTPLTIREWRRQREILYRPSEFEQLDVGFSTFYLNRCNRSGILAGGGVIGGLKQKGKWKMHARFSRKDLIARVLAIAARKESVTVKNWDAETFIKEYIPKLPKKSLLYCDPPYFLKGKRLYFDHYAPGDHARIARLIQNSVRRHWLASYDGTPEILKHYSERRSFLYSVQYNAASAYKGTETFIFSDDLKLPVNSTVLPLNNALQLRAQSERHAASLEPL